jgi:hypothetical protein
VKFRSTAAIAFCAVISCISCYSPIYDINLSKAKPHVKAWSIIGGLNFTGGGSTTPSIAIAPDGTPFVGYIDGLWGNQASMMYMNGNAWTYLGSQGFTGRSIWDPAIAIDSGSRYYLAFRDDSTYSNKISVYRYASGWAPLGSPGFSPDAGLLTCLAIDPTDGNPVVAYQNSSGSATAMKFDGSTWNLIGGAGFTSGAVSYLSLAIDPSGIPYIGFRDDYNSYFATVMKYDLGSWSAVGIPAFSSGWANYTSLVIDSSGRPYLGYQDSVYVAKVMEFNGSSWQDLGNADLTSGSNVDRVSLAISKASFSLNALYLAYSRQLSSVPPVWSVSVMEFNGSSWDIVGSPNFYTDSTGPDFLQLAIAPSDGTPYVSIRNPSGGVVTVLAFR